jgi:hypothetical protein
MRIVIATVKDHLEYGYPSPAGAHAASSALTITHCIAL